MHVVVIGAGAMGSLLAGYLREGGLHVTIVAHHARQAAAINECGLSIEGVRGSMRVFVPAVLDARECSPADLILVCVKAYDTGAALAQHESVFAQGQVLTLQNGIGNVEVLARRVPSMRILAGTTTLGVNLVEPGVVIHAGEGQTLIGPAADIDEEPALEIAEALSKAGIVTTVAANINELLWQKLCVNAAINAQTALLRVRNGALADLVPSRELMCAAVLETVAVAAVQGITLDADEMIERAVRTAELTGENRSSMLMDILRERRTEIEYINGAVVRLGAQVGVDTPVNRVLTHLVTTLELTYDRRVKTD
ncbi:MAG TPA: ketopantoate reductase family protein [bacterium]|nr:ketopantoate reductase family protein [bacterium]